MRDFTVKKGVMGYIVTIGCQVAGFSNKEDLLKAISEYVNDPEATEKKYYHGSAGVLSGAAIQQQYNYTNPVQGSTTYATHLDGITLTNANINSTAMGLR